MREERHRRWWGLYLIDGFWEVHTWERPPRKPFRMQYRVGDRARAERMREVWNRGRKSHGSMHGSPNDGKTGRSSAKRPIIPVIGRDAEPPLEARKCSKSPSESSSPPP